MRVQFDPWRHASELAARIGPDHSVLVVLVGAEHWCARCRELRPRFNQLAETAPPHEVWLWLDIEDHADFIDHVPENLPVLFLYKGPAMSCSQVIDDAGSDLRALVDAGMARAHDGGSPDLGIRQRLLLSDWARG